MGFVYLIGEYNDSNSYKIGVTNNKTVNGRKNELQTGNSDELFIVNKYETNEPFKLEKMLHNHYHSNHKINEWFTLSDDEVFKFIEVCDKYQNIINSLKDNPFFNKRKNR